MPLDATSRATSDATRDSPNLSPPPIPQWDRLTPRPAPPTYLGPKPNRPELIVDVWRVFLQDPTDGTFVGLYDGMWGKGGPPGRVLDAKRAGTRDL